MKRVIGRPWGHRHKGGWIIQPASLVAAIKPGDAVTIGDITVGTKNLIQIINSIDFPDQELLLLHANGKLEFQNIARYFVPSKKHPGTRTCQYRLPRLRHYFSVCDGAWLKKNKETKTLIVLKPKKF